MRRKIINFLKRHPAILRFFWFVIRCALGFVGLFIRVKPKTMVFASFGGRKFDDSPKAIYDGVCKDEFFNDWKLIWAFNDPAEFEIPRGEKVKMDTWGFFKCLLSANVWVSNSGMDRGIGLPRKRKRIRVETWHGTPLKKIGGEENTASIGGKRKKTSRKKRDNKTIRCAQSEFDREIFTRLFHAEKEAILLSDLPRNDALLQYTEEEKQSIRERLGVADGKKIILYMPTYREYLVDSENKTYLAPPMDMEKWEKMLGDKYCLLMRAHYAVEAALALKETEFLKTVSAYPTLNDLYAVADIMISDYSSAFFDYSILDRPMFCFAYDLAEYEEKRGLYLPLKETLPCAVCATEDELLADILQTDTQEASERTKAFHARFAPFAGKATETVVEKIKQRVQEQEKRKAS